MFVAPLRHLLREVLEIDFGKERRLVLPKRLAVIRAARGAGRDPEGLAPECSIRRGHHDLRPDTLLVAVISPRELTQATARAVVGVGRQGRGGRETNQRDSHLQENKFLCHTPPPCWLD